KTRRRSWKSFSKRSPAVRLTEIENRPVVRARVRAQASIGVDRGGASDDGEHWIVGKTIGICVRLIQPQSVLQAGIANAIGLVRALHDGRYDLAGSESFDELERICDEIVGAEVIDQRLHGDIDRARAEDDLAPRAAR